MVVLDADLSGLTKLGHLGEASLPVVLGAAQK